MRGKLKKRRPRKPVSHPVWRAWRNRDGAHRFNIAGADSWADNRQNEDLDLPFSAHNEKVLAGVSNELEPIFQAAAGGMAASIEETFAGFLKKSDRRELHRATKKYLEHLNALAFSHEKGEHVLEQIRAERSRFISFLKRRFTKEKDRPLAEALRASYEKAAQEVLAVRKRIDSQLMEPAANRFEARRRELLVESGLVAEVRKNIEAAKAEANKAITDLPTSTPVFAGKAEFEVQAGTPLMLGEELIPAGHAGPATPVRIEIGSDALRTAIDTLQTALAGIQSGPGDPTQKQNAAMDRVHQAFNDAGPIHTFMEDCARVNAWADTPEVKAAQTFYGELQSFRDELQRYYGFPSLLTENYTPFALEPLQTVSSLPDLTSRYHPIDLGVGDIEPEKLNEQFQNLREEISWAETAEKALACINQAKRQPPLFQLLLTDSPAKTQAEQYLNKLERNVRALVFALPAHLPASIQVVSPTPLAPPAPREISCDAVKRAMDNLSSKALEFSGETAKLQEAFDETESDPDVAALLALNELHLDANVRSLYSAVRQYLDSVKTTFGLRGSNKLPTLTLDPTWQPLPTVPIVTRGSVFSTSFNLALADLKFEADSPAWQSASALQHAIEEAKRNAEVQKVLAAKDPSGDREVDAAKKALLDLEAYARSLPQSFATRAGVQLQAAARAAAPALTAIDSRQVAAAMAALDRATVQARGEVKPVADAIRAAEADAELKKLLDAQDAQLSPENQALKAAAAAHVDAMRNYLGPQGVIAEMDRKIEAARQNAALTPTQKIAAIRAALNEAQADEKVKAFLASKKSEEKDLKEKAQKHFKAIEASLEVTTKAPTLGLGSNTSPEVRALAEEVRLAAFKEAAKKLSEDFNTRLNNLLEALQKGEVDAESFGWMFEQLVEEHKTAVKALYEPLKEKIAAATGTDAVKAEVLKLVDKTHETLLAEATEAEKGVAEKQKKAELDADEYKTKLYLLRLLEPKNPLLREDPPLSDKEKEALEKLLKEMNIAERLQSHTDIEFGEGIALRMKWVPATTDKEAHEGKERRPGYWDPGKYTLDVDENNASEESLVALGKALAVLARSAATHGGELVVTVNKAKNLRSLQKILRAAAMHVPPIRVIVKDPRYMGEVNQGRVPELLKRETEARKQDREIFRYLAELGKVPLGKATLNPDTFAVKTEHGELKCPEAWAKDAEVQKQLKALGALANTVAKPEDDKLKAFVEAAQTALRDNPTATGKLAANDALATGVKGSIKARLDDLTNADLTSLIVRRGEQNSVQSTGALLRAKLENFSHLIAALDCLDPSEVQDKKEQLLQVYGQLRREVAQFLHTAEQAGVQHPENLIASSQRGLQYSGATAKTKSEIGKLTQDVLSPVAAGLLRIGVSNDVVRAAGLARTPAAKEAKLATPRATTAEQDIAIQGKVLGELFKAIPEATATPQEKAEWYGRVLDSVAKLQGISRASLEEAVADKRLPEAVLWMLPPEGAKELDSMELLERLQQIQGALRGVLAAAQAHFTAYETAEGRLKEARVAYQKIREAVDAGGGKPSAEQRTKLEEARAAVQTQETALKGAKANVMGRVSPIFSFDQLLALHRMGQPATDLLVAANDACNEVVRQQTAQTAAILDGTIANIDASLRTKLGVTAANLPTADQVLALGKGFEAILKGGAGRSAYARDLARACQAVTGLPFSLNRAERERLLENNNVDFLTKVLKWAFVYQHLDLSLNIEAQELRSNQTGVPAFARVLGKWQEALNQQFASYGDNPSPELKNAYANFLREELVAALIDSTTNNFRAYTDPDIQAALQVALPTANSAQDTEAERLGRCITDGDPAADFRGFFARVLTHLQVQKHQGIVAELYQDDVQAVDDALAEIAKGKFPSDYVKKCKEVTGFEPTEDFKNTRVLGGKTGLDALRDQLLERSLDMHLEAVQTPRITANMTAAQITKALATYRENFEREYQACLKAAGTADTTAIRTRFADCLRQDLAGVHANASQDIQAALQAALPVANGQETEAERLRRCITDGDPAADFRTFFGQVLTHLQVQKHQGIIGELYENKVQVVDHALAEVAKGKFPSAYVKACEAQTGFAPTAIFREQQVVDGKTGLDYLRDQLLERSLALHLAAVQEKKPGITPDMRAAQITKALATYRENFEREYQACLKAAGTADKTAIHAQFADRLRRDLQSIDATQIQDQAARDTLQAVLPPPAAQAAAAAVGAGVGGGDDNDADDAAAAPVARGPQVSDENPLQSLRDIESNYVRALQRAKRFEIAHELVKDLSAEEATRALSDPEKLFEPEGQLVRYAQARWPFREACQRLTGAPPEEALKPAFRAALVLELVGTAGLAVNNQRDAQLGQFQGYVEEQLARVGGILDAKAPRSAWFAGKSPSIRDASMSAPQFVAALQDHVKKLQACYQRLSVLARELGSPGMDRRLETLFFRKLREDLGELRNGQGSAQGAKVLENLSRVHLARRDPVLVLSQISHALQDEARRLAVGGARTGVDPGDDPLGVRVPPWRGPGLRNGGDDGL